MLVLRSPRNTGSASSEEVVYLHFKQPFSVCTTTTNRMKVCVLNEFFHPDSSTGTGRVVSSIARSLQDDYGADVTAIASRNPYRQGSPLLSESEEWDGIAIRRGTSPDNNRKSTPLRFYSNSVLAKRAFSLAEEACPDVLLVTTAPPVMPAAALKMLKRHGVPYVYIVYDLEPNRTLALKVVKPTSPAAKLLAKAQGEWLRNAHRVVAIGRCMAEIVERQYKVPKERIAFIPVGTPAFDTKDDGKEFRKKNNLSGFLAVYSGNFARYHEFDTILDAAELLQKKSSDITIVMIGAGFHKGYIEDQVAAKALKNVRLLPFVPDEEYGGMLNGSDVCLVSLKPAVVGTCVPSKFYTQLAAGRPTIAIMPEYGEVARVLRESNSGLVVEPGNPAELVRSLERLKDNPAEAKTMGESAVKVFGLKYTEEAVVREIFACLKSAAENASQGK